MFTHYLRILLRKNTAFTAINLAGLVIGTTACLLIFKYVQYEHAYDRQSPYADHIWRVFNQTMNGETVVTEDANSHSAVGPTLKAEVADVVDFARLYNAGKSEITVIADGQAHEIKHFYSTDPGFLRMFPQRVLQGNLDNCLSESGMAVLTESNARNVFGTGSALGKHFRINGGMCAGDYTVTAVVADPPENTHLKFGILTSNATRITNGHEDNFESYWEYTYLQLRPGAGPEHVQRCLAGINERYLKQEGIRLNIQRFSDIHLHSNLTYELEPNGSAKIVRFLSLIALLILCIAFINYINLTTAMAGDRAKEVGVRKSIGASRSALTSQFLIENALISAAAFGISVLLLKISLPLFNNLIGRPLYLSNTGFEGVFWAQMAGLFIGMALLAGIYPAMMMSGFAPVKALSGRVLGSGGALRRFLVVLQFAFSGALIFGVIVVSRQVDFLKNHDLGLQLEQLVAIKAQPAEDSNDTLANRRLASFKQTCGQLSGISGIAASSIAPGLGINTISGSNRPLHWVKNPTFAKATSYFVSTDEHFFDLYGVKVLAGQPQYFADRERQRSHAVINRAMLETLGFPDAQSAVGERIAYENAENGAQTIITAVVDNFHIEPLKVPAKPTLYYYRPIEQLSYLTIKINAANVESSLAQLQQSWARIYPEMPFRYWFLDDHFAAQYQSEKQFEHIFGIFALLAICISCLGLFGLATHHTEQRRKEIGIRKVLGASVTGITALLAKDFLKLVVIAIVIALPVSYYLMERWLTDFAYRIEMAWWMFAMAGATAVLIAFLTVGFQSVKAALANPVKSLRSE